MNEAPSLGTIRTTHRPRPRTIRGHDSGCTSVTPAAGPTILVVDDNPATRRFVRETLAIEGYRVIEADGGAGAIEACEHETPALVLIDLCMSDMRGTDVLRRLRSQPNTTSTPIIVFTGAPEEIDDTHSDAQDAFSDLIAKPADAVVLLETVRAHLDPPPQAASALPGPGRPRKVLLADGDPARSIRLRLHLRRLGFDTMVATNAETAACMARQERPDAIIADLMLSDGASLQLTRDLKADVDLARVPIVISSSTPWRQVQERLALRAGATAFVVTTPDLGSIRDALVTALETPPTVTGHETDDLLDGDERSERALTELHRQHTERRDAARSLERSQAELAVLQGLTEIVGGSGDLDAVLTEALARCLHAIGASRGAVFLTDLDGSFGLHAHLGDLGRLPGARLAAGEDLFHRVTSSQETVVVDDGSEGDARPSTIVTPIVSGEECSGVLVVEVPAHEDLRFWMHFLQLAGLGLGFAVANARQAQRLPRESDGLDMSDPLTGLATATRLELNLATALEDASGGRSGTMLLVDVDRIRHVNDALGHHTGDQLLKGIARRLAAVVNPDMTLARLHGDVFAVLAPAVVSVEEAVDLARRLLGTLEAPFRCNGYTLYATASVGVALYPDHARRPGELLQHAHSALDLAKGRGGDTCEVYTERTGDTLWQRLTLEQGLRAALEREQFVLHYQPIVDLGTAEVTAAEALLRWDRPLHGVTTAAGFIEIAEETGLIVPIGAWVIGEAAAQVAEWGGRGIGIQRLAVNVGAREFHDAHVEDRVRRAVDETGIEPSSLSLEITEGVALADVDHAVATLSRLRDLGVHTALDDFGTGYSSLRYLQELPIDTVKIDRSFVANAAADDRGRPILESIVELSHRLGMRVIAEGIETDRCLELVRSLGCDEAQGFHLGRPAPADALEGLL